MVDIYKHRVNKSNYRLNNIIMMHTFISSQILKKRCDQAYFILHSQVQSSLSKAANGLLYQEECNIADGIYEDNFDAFN